MITKVRHIFLFKLIIIIVISLESDLLSFLMKQWRKLSKFNTFRDTHTMIRLHYWSNTGVGYWCEFVMSFLFGGLPPKRIEYILEGNLLEKSVKRQFCWTVSILQVYFTYLCYITFWALEYHFTQTLCLSLYKRWFSVININEMMFFIHLIHYKVYLGALKNSKLKRIV